MTAKRTEVARSTLSHHLHKLIAVGLVYQERQATTLYCHADYLAMDETICFLARECCADVDGCVAAPRRRLHYASVAAPCPRRPVR